MSDRFSRDRQWLPYAGKDEPLHHVMCTICNMWSGTGITKGEAQAALFKHRLTHRERDSSGSEGLT